MPSSSKEMSSGKNTEFESSKAGGDVPRSDVIPDKEVIPEKEVQVYEKETKESKERKERKIHDHVQRTEIDDRYGLETYFSFIIDDPEQADCFLEYPQFDVKGRHPFRITAVSGSQTITSSSIFKIFLWFASAQVGTAMIFSFFLQMIWLHRQ